jgi:hypothetical protein
MVKAVLSAKGIEKELARVAGITRKSGETQRSWVTRLVKKALAASQEEIDGLHESAYNYADAVGTALQEGGEIKDFDDTVLEDEAAEKPAKKGKGADKKKAKVEEPDDDDEADDEEEAEEGEEADDEEEAEEEEDDEDADDEEVADEDDEDADDESDEDDADDDESDDEDDEDADDESDDEDDEDADDESDEDDDDDDEDADDESDDEDADESEEDDEDDDEEPNEDEDDDMRTKAKGPYTGKAMSGTQAYREAIIRSAALSPYTSGYDRNVLLELGGGSIGIGKNNRSAVLFHTRETLRVLKDLGLFTLPEQKGTKVKPGPITKKTKKEIRKAAKKAKVAEKPAKKVKVAEKPTKKAKVAEKPAKKSKR